MSKNRIAFFLSLIFISITITPTILFSFDSDYNLSISIDLNEEENKGNELNKLFEFDDFEIKYGYNHLLTSEDNSNFSFYSMTYKSIQVSLHSPPPDLS